MGWAEVRKTWHRRLVVRYTATLVAVALGSAALVGVPLYFLAWNLLEHELAERLEGTAELGALLLDAGSGVPLADLREEADLDALCVLAPDGTVVDQAALDPEGCRLQRAELAEARAALRLDSTHSAIRRGRNGDLSIFAFAPIGEPGQATTVIAVRGAVGYLSRLQLLQALFGGAGLLWIALVLLFGVVSATRLVRPVRGLLLAIRQLGAGGPAPPIESGGPLELEELELAFAEMAREVLVRETRLKALAGAVAHEVRNPAHALRLHLGLLRRHLSTDPPDRARERLDTLGHELDLLDATVEAFLVFARDQSARRSPVDLRAVLEQWADGAPVDAPAAVVEVDPHLIGRAIANLVRNAREAGGVPTVRARVDDESVAIEVEDDGPGFPPPLVNTAFEPFVSGRAGGSGLGLAIVAAIAVAHGGSADLIPRQGRTLVRLTLSRR
ncbi:MAG: HAMP domain-containing sensor histidine kinase [Myxococcota bacterium]